jgi:hypothetical protein
MQCPTAKSLGVNVTLPIKFSSINKGEDLKDMIRTLNALNPDFSGNAVDAWNLEALFIFH